MDALRIVKILNDNSINTDLANAMGLAEQIVSEFNSENFQKLDEAWVAGHKVGIYEGKQQAKNEGLTLEKNEVVRLRGCEDFAYAMAREAAPKVVNEIGIEFKIKCIKELRNRFPFLGLKDAKDMIDAEVKKIKDAEEAARLANMSNDYDDSYDYGCGWDCGICNPR